eukprot:4074974-Pleurochrysis_carterae.AAC.1
MAEYVAVVPLCDVAGALVHVPLDDSCFGTTRAPEESLLAAAQRVCLHLCGAAPPCLAGYSDAIGQSAVFFVPCDVLPRAQAADSARPHAAPTNRYARSAWFRFERLCGSPQHSTAAL